MNPTTNNISIDLFQLEQSLYDLKTYVKDMFLTVIGKIDDMETKISQLKYLQSSKKKTEGTNNKSVLGEYVESGSISNRRDMNDSTGSLEPQHKKMKVQVKNETQILSDSPKKIMREDEKGDEEEVKIDEEVNKIYEKEYIKTNEKDTKTNEKDTKTNEKDTKNDGKDTKTNEKDTKSNEKDTKKKSKSKKEKLKGQDFLVGESNTKDPKKHNKLTKEEDKMTDKKEIKKSKEILVDKLVDNVSKKDTQSSNKPDAATLIASEFSYKGKHTDRTYDLLKMKERFYKNFGDNWFTVPKCCKLFFNSIRKPPTEEWIAALDCMVEKRMLDRNEGEKLRYKVIE